MEKIPEERVNEEVKKDLDARVVHGVKKYGITLDRTDLKLRDWLQHAYEESLDFVKYLKRAMIELDEKNNLP